MDDIRNSVAAAAASDLKADYVTALIQKDKQNTKPAANLPPLAQSQLPVNPGSATSLPTAGPSNASKPMPSKAGGKRPSELDQQAGIVYSNAPGPGQVHMDMEGRKPLVQRPGESFEQRMHRIGIDPKHTVRGGYQPVKHPTTGEESRYKGITDESIDRWEMNQRDAAEWDKNYKGKGGQNPYRNHGRSYTKEEQIERCLTRRNHPKGSCGYYCTRTERTRKHI